MKEKSQHRVISNKCTKRTTAAMPLNELKLAIALELKLEGYTYITFDKVVDIDYAKARVHVLAEDELGLSLAVICINRSENLDPNTLLDLVSDVQRKLGEDCEVAIAIPLALLDKAADVFGFTPRMFMVDNKFRVWVHYGRHGVTDEIRSNLLSHVATNDMTTDYNIKNAQHDLHVQMHDMKYIV